MPADRGSGILTYADPPVLIWESVLSRSNARRTSDFGDKGVSGRRVLVLVVSVVSAEAVTTAAALVVVDILVEIVEAAAMYNVHVQR